MTEHVGCILAVVGSRDVPRAPAIELIRRVLDEHKPVIVISGGAAVNRANRMRGLASIDEEVAIEANLRQLQVLEFRPTDFHWDAPGGFKERNIHIADSCVCLVRIASETTTTYGSGWTADHAEMLGKDVTRYTIKKDGLVIEGVPAHEQRR
jgi:hypothetical protein